MAKPSALGLFTLSIGPLPAPPANDNVAGAVELTDSLPVSVTGSGRGATLDGDPYFPRRPDWINEVFRPTVWYRWVAPADGIYVWDTCPTDVEAFAAVFAGEPQALTDIGGEATQTWCTALSPFGGRNVIGNAWTFEAQAGVAYHLMVASAPAEFTATLRRLAPPVNDEYESPTVLSGKGLPISVSGTTRDATRTPEEPRPDGEHAMPAVWYRWTATLNGPVVLDTCEHGPEQVATAVYTGPVADAVPVPTPSVQGCGVDGLGTASTFAAVKGTTYQIGVRGQGETFRLTLRRPAPPANDSFGRAAKLRSMFGQTAQGTLLDATVDHKDPSTWAPSPIGPSVWYSWAPTQTGAVSMRVCGGPVNFFVLEVYKGADQRTLLPVEYNIGLGCAVVQFEAQRSTAYRIMVSTDGAAGPFTLELAARVIVAD